MGEEGRQSQRKFPWRDPNFTYADALTGARLIMLPYLIYALAVRLPGMTLLTLLAMIATDLIDGRIARRMGQSRTSGSVFDSAVDFIVIYALFTTFFVIGLLAWWKWAVIFLPAILMAVTQLRHLRATPEVAFAPARVGKLVGQIQYAYLPFLVLRTFWWTEPWAQTVDHLIFTILVPPTILNAVDHLRTLRHTG